VAGTAKRHRGLGYGLAVVSLVGALATASLYVELPGRGAPSVAPGVGAPPTPTVPPPDSCGRQRLADDAKPVLRGLVGINGVGSAGEVLDAMTVTARWADLQPRQGGPLERPNVIDRALEQVRKAPSCRWVKLRVLAGVEAPQWVKQLDGPPVTMELEYDGRQGSVPRFWTPAYSAAYARLQRLLGEAYDDEPRIREVVMSSCTTFYAEPLLRQASDGVNVSALRAAGYDAEADATCQREQFLAHRAWRRTASSFALNPYDMVPAVGPVAVDPQAALGFAEDCRALLADRCVLANNSVRWPVLSGPYEALYEGMALLGPPLAYQLAAPRRIGDPVEAVRWTVRQGAASVELVPDVAEQHAAALEPLSSELTGGS
jgi:hypothetical protein